MEQPREIPEAMKLQMLSTAADSILRLLKIALEGHTKKVYMNGVLGSRKVRIENYRFTLGYEEGYYFDVIEKDEEKIGLQFAFDDPHAGVISLWENGKVIANLPYKPAASIKDFSEFDTLYPVLEKTAELFEKLFKVLKEKRDAKIASTQKTRESVADRAKKVT